MFDSLISSLFQGYLTGEMNENMFSYSKGWKNIITVHCKNRLQEPARIDIRLAFGDVTCENLVDFIDYKSLPEKNSYPVAEYNIVYLGYFAEKIPSGNVSHSFFIDKTCKSVIHHYVDLATEEKISAHLRGNYSPDFSKLNSIPMEKRGSSDPSAIKNFGLRTKGIFKENRPGLPLISIIIPSFNSEKVIEQAIQSAIVQSYENKEILIIDGNSKDSTARVVKKYEDQIDWFNSEPDKNIFDAINKGTCLSKGEYSVFIGSDDLLCYNSLEKVVENITAGGEKDFYYGNGLTLTASGFIKKSICFLNGKNYSQFRIYHPALYIKRNVFTELEGFNIDYFIAADLDFELKLITSKKSYSKIESYLCIYRGGGFSSRFLMTKIKQVRTILNKYNSLDISYFMLNIRMILLEIIKRMVGSRFFNLLSVYKYRIKRIR